ncbi:hypothetical protein ABW21_db0208580 [Orbilia brochopaga]|nr:hypothetical protein ABW21_db0208580 [Drechslerella brochopaga]
MNLDELTHARWHPSRFRHHFITNYLFKAKDKHKPTVAITVCTAFMLDELARGERTIEIDVVSKLIDFEYYHTLLIPTEIASTERRNSNGDVEKRWITYLVVWDEFMPSRFPIPDGGDPGNVIIVTVGAQRSVECEQQILELLYRKAALPVPKGTVAYSLLIAQPDELYDEYLQPNHTRLADLEPGYRVTFSGTW